MAEIHSSLACNLEDSLLQAALPLFAAEKVAALEWSFDTLYAQNSLPGWFTELLTTYGEAGRLVGHGVFFSLLSGRWTPDQQVWLDHLKSLSQQFRFDHISEHFGFMTGPDFHKGAPLNVPMTSVTLALGQDRLLRIQDACGCPVGLENLAFAYSLDDVKRQGDFINRLLETVNGFVIIDIHNLYCQSCNFGLSPIELMALYPPDRVRELHVSGGSWQPSISEPGRQIRRDTHDDAVPDEVFTWLETAIDQCSNLRYVVLEQLGTALTTETERAQFRADFDRMDTIIQQKNKVNRSMSYSTFMPKVPLIMNRLPLENGPLHNQQLDLSAILETATDHRQAQARLADSSLANSAWKVETWQPSMLEAAIAIAKKWKNGF